MNSPTITETNKPKSTKKLARWQKQYVALQILTLVIVWIACDIIRTRTEAIIFFLVAGVATYMTATAALLKSFDKEK